MVEVSSRCWDVRGRGGRMGIFMVGYWLVSGG